MPVDPNFFDNPFFNKGLLFRTDQKIGAKLTKAEIAETTNGSHSNIFFIVDGDNHCYSVFYDKVTDTYHYTKNKTAT